MDPRKHEWRRAGFVWRMRTEGSPIPQPQGVRWLLPGIRVRAASDARFHCLLVINWSPRLSAWSRRRQPKQVPQPLPAEHSTLTWIRWKYSRWKRLHTLMELAGSFSFVSRNEDSLADQAGPTRADKSYASCQITYQSVELHWTVIATT